ncbi:uncharacterized protein V5649_020337 [Rhynchonycteris naso]
MMLRSPLPAAAASHTTSHVSFPLFFFFLTSARGGAATARPLTSPLLARPRPGWGRGGGGPGASASPGPAASGMRREGARAAAAAAAAAARWEAQPSSRGRPLGAKHGSPAWPGRPRRRPRPRFSGRARWGYVAAPRVSAGSLSCPRPLRTTRPEAAGLRLREKREIAKLTHSQIGSIIF